jgi:hypothetical protein
VNFLHERFFETLGEKNKKKNKKKNIYHFKDISSDPHQQSGSLQEYLKLTS